MDTSEAAASEEPAAPEEAEQMDTSGGQARRLRVLDTPSHGKIMASLLFVEFYEKERDDGSKVLIPFILEMLTVASQRQKGHMNVLMEQMVDAVDDLMASGKYTA
eukprot:2880357-Prymnesium_polylepis.1